MFALLLAPSSAGYSHQSPNGIKAFKKFKKTKAAQKTKYFEDVEWHRDKSSVWLPSDSAVISSLPRGVSELDKHAPQLPLRQTAPAAANSMNKIKLVHARQTLGK